MDGNKSNGILLEVISLIGNKVLKYYARFYFSPLEKIKTILQ